MDSRNTSSQKALRADIAHRYVLIDNRTIKSLHHLNLTAVPDVIIASPDDNSISLAKILAAQHSEAALKIDERLIAAPSSLLTEFEGTSGDHIFFIVCPVDTAKTIGNLFESHDYDSILKVNDDTLIKNYPKQRVELLKEKDAEEYYNDIYPEMIYSWQADDSADFRAKFIGNHKDENILDLGCANGKLVESLVSSNNVYGVDISRELVQKANHNGLRATVCNIDKSRLPYEDSFFDMIIGFDIFEHLFYPPKVIKELHRVMKKGGTLKVSIPIKHANRHATMAYFLNKTAKNLGIEHDLASVVPDINLYSFEDTKAMFNDNGFSLLHAEGWEWPWKKTSKDRAEFLKQHPEDADDVFLEFIK